ncbi:glycine-rich domain-containing protein [Rhodococcus triatomae]
MRSNLVVFTANGTWVKPPNLYAIEVRVRSGGGGGGSGATRDGASDTNTPGGPGGGGGTLVQTNRRIPAAELPATVAVTVGPGGAGGAVSSTPNTFMAGKHGGTSRFGDILLAEGGYGGGYGADPNGSVNTGNGGYGGWGIFRGGTGGANGIWSPNQNAFAAPVQRCSGGGGGGSGAGLYSGTPRASSAYGWSGFTGAPHVHNPVWWQWDMSGNGAYGRTEGSNNLGNAAFPCGGGGGGWGGNATPMSGTPASGLAGAGGPGAAGVVTVFEYLFDLES